MTDRPTPTGTAHGLRDGPPAKAAMALGYAGLLPQAIAVFLAWSGGEWGFVAMAAGFAYGALIFSFLGGVWWGQSVSADRISAAAFFASVLPSLIALGLFMPWTFGLAWPGPSLLYLGLLIAASPLVDRWLGVAPAWFMRLRWHLSIGLGILTALLGWIALQRV